MLQKTAREKSMMRLIEGANRRVTIIKIAGRF
jgi:hypothetical protein